MRRILLKLFTITTVLFLGYIVPSYAAEDFCTSLEFSVIGPEFASKSVIQNYYASVQYLRTGVSLDVLSSVLDTATMRRDARITWEVLKAWTVLSRQNGTWFSYTFAELGNYLVRTTIVYDGCRYVLEKNVQTYNDLYVYIGSFMSEFNRSLLTNIKQNKYILYTYIPTDEDLGRPDVFAQSLMQQMPYLTQTKTIFLSMENYARIFDIIYAMQKADVDFESVKIFVISTTNKTIVKKILARFMKETGLRSIYVISPQDAQQIFLQMSIDNKQPYSDLLLLTSRIWFDDGWFQYSFNHLIDYLLFNGFPLEVLKLLLATSFIIIFIVFCKQVIGFNSFGVYYPLLFAYSLHTIWLKTTIALFVLAIISRIFVSLVTRQFTLLATAKLGLQILSYVIFSFVGMALYSWLFSTSYDFAIFSNGMIVIAYIALFLTAAKVWNMNLSYTSPKQWLSILWFIILSYISYFILRAWWVHDLLLMYPIFLIVSIIIVIVLGRFTGLQLIEYYRFWPLLKRLYKRHTS